MKNKHLLIGLLLAAIYLSGCAAQRPVTTPPPQNLDHVITLSWSQSFADNPPCSSTVTVSCYSGFNEGYLVGATQTQLHTDTTAVCTGTTQPETCTTTFNGLVPLGPVTFYVTATGVNQSGTAITSSSATSAAVNVSLDPPTGVNATVQ